MLQPNRARMKRLVLQFPFMVLAGCATPQVESDPSPSRFVVQRAAVRTATESSAANKNTRGKALVKKRETIAGDTTGSTDEKWRLRGSTLEIEKKEGCEYDANDLKLKGPERTQFVVQCTAHEERAVRDVQPKSGPD
jgi:hypothetical protein